MRKIFYHDFENKDFLVESTLVESLSFNNFLNEENKKLKVRVKMFDCLVGLGHGRLEDGTRVYLNAYNIITKNCGLGLALDEKILADIEILEDGDLFARNIERDIKR